MTAYATSPYQMQNPSETGAPQLSPEERDKLRIHELINLLLRELPVTAQARSTAMPILRDVHLLSNTQFPCG
jgi:hypothetical protein